jgi:cellulose biosynthesis protein BcsQ
MIYTFYSYKGGVGRSMALANVADTLARAGLRVLMIDFDLEAPGLEQFFQINHYQVRHHLGLLDLLLSYKQAMSLGPTESEEASAFRRLKELFIMPVYDQLPSGGRLDLLPSGQRADEEQVARYALNLRTFDWQDFYFNWAGELFFEWLRQSLIPDLYDVVLVDSRTGVTEMGGICACQLADAVVMLCAPNRQNVEGTHSVVQNFLSPRVRALRQNRPLQVLVVPARVEQRDRGLVESFRDRFERSFASYTPQALQQRGRTFWDLQLPYEPRYAFEEQVVSEPDRVKERHQVASAFRELVNAIILLSELAKVI